MKDFEKFVEEMKTNEVTITEAEMSNIIADTMSDEQFVMIIKEIPATMLLLSMFGSSIVYKIFHKDEEKKEESEATE